MHCARLPFQIEDLMANDIGVAFNLKRAACRGHTSILALQKIDFTTCICLLSSITVLITFRTEKIKCTAWAFSMQVQLIHLRSPAVPCGPLRSPAVPCGPLRCKGAPKYPGVLDQRSQKEDVKKKRYGP